MTEQHIALSFDVVPGWVLIHSQYAAVDDIRAFPAHRRWDVERRAWKVPEIEIDGFVDFMRGRGYVVHDERKRPEVWRGDPRLEPPPWKDLV